MDAFALRKEQEKGRRRRAKKALAHSKHQLSSLQIAPLAEGARIFFFPRIHCSFRRDVFGSARRRWSGIVGEDSGFSIAKHVFFWVESVLEQ